MRRVTLVLTALLLAVCVAGPTLAARIQSDDPERHLYDHVMQEFIHRDFAAALAGFQFFLELYGDAPLAPSALYWKGECELRLGRHRDALHSFTAVLSRYPVSSKQAAAALKAGLTYAKLGQPTQSRQMLERVMVQFPNTTEAELARKALGSLS